MAYAETNSAEGSDSPLGSPCCSRLIRSKISSRCTATLFGALIPMRTWLPFTPNTVTVTSFPIITVSPTRLVRISMLLSPLLAVVSVATGNAPAVDFRLETYEVTPERGDQRNPETTPRGRSCDVLRKLRFRAYLPVPERKF